MAGLPTVIAAIQGFLQRLLCLLLFFSHCLAPMIFFTYSCAELL
jgi:hypothetical protein